MMFPVFVFLPHGNFYIELETGDVDIEVTAFKFKFDSDHQPEISKFTSMTRMSSAKISISESSIMMSGRPGRGGKVPSPDVTGSAAAAAADSVN
jgi:hypothetical protein